VPIGLCVDTASFAAKPVGQHVRAGLDEFLTVSKKAFAILGHHPKPSVRHSRQAIIASGIERAATTLLAKI